MVAMICFMWRSQANPPSNFSPSAPHDTELGFRILTCVSFAITSIYFTLAVIKSTHDCAPKDPDTITITLYLKPRSSEPSSSSGSSVTGMAKKDD
jgi:hypothetical protein